MSRDKLASYLISHVGTFDPAEFPKPCAAFEQWSKSIEEAVTAAVRTVTKDAVAGVHKWMFDPHEQRFSFSYERHMEIAGQKAWVCRTFWLDPKNQKPMQRKEEGPLWDEIWTVAEEVKQHDQRLETLVNKI